MRKPNPGERLTSGFHPWVPPCKTYEFSTRSKVTGNRSDMKHWAGTGARCPTHFAIRSQQLVDGEAEHCIDDLRETVQQLVEAALIVSNELIGAIPPPPWKSPLLRGGGPECNPSSEVHAAVVDEAAGLGEWRACLPTLRGSARKHTTKQPSKHPELCVLLE